MRFGAIGRLDIKQERQDDQSSGENTEQASRHPLTHVPVTFRAKYKQKTLADRVPTAFEWRNFIQQKALKLLTAVNVAAAAVAK